MYFLTSPCCSDETSACSAHLAQSQRCPRETKCWCIGSACAEIQCTWMEYERAVKPKAEWWSWWWWWWCSTMDSAKDRLKEQFSGFQLSSETSVYLCIITKIIQTKMNPTRLRYLKIKQTGILWWSRVTVIVPKWRFSSYNMRFI